MRGDLRPQQEVMDLGHVPALTSWCARYLCHLSQIHTAANSMFTGSWTDIAIIKLKSCLQSPHASHTLFAAGVRLSTHSKQLDIALPGEHILVDPE